MPRIGIGLGLGLFGTPSGAGGGFDADYQTILNLATAAGYTLPSSGQQTLQNQLLLDLKSGGVWSKLDTFALFANDVNIVNPIPNPYSNAFALIDWVRSVNTNTLVTYTAVNSPTFTTNQGFMGNGTSSYVDTNYNPQSGVNYTLNNASRYFFPHAFSGTGRMDGATSVGQNGMIRQSGTSQRINSGNNNLATAFDYTAVIEPKSIHRTSSVSVDLFNGTVGTTGVQTSTSILNSNQFVLRSGTGYGAHTVSAYAMGASMVSENTAFVNAYNTYKSAL
jgi:hypothetical protein